jgi:hypothetical protein
MAILANKLSVCIKNDCSKITFRDVTELYDSTTNTKGWGNDVVTTGVKTSDISGSVVILSKFGEVPPVNAIYSFNVSDYPANASEEFNLPERDWTKGDGIYNVSYIISLLPESVHSVENFTDRILITCEAENCVSNLWKRYLNSEKTEDREKAFEAEGYLKAAQAAFLCNSNSDSKKILNFLAKVCALADNDCGCGCS